VCSATVGLLRLAAILLLLAGGAAFAQQPATQAALDEAAAAFEQGKAAEAGQKLESILRTHPTELRALILEGAVLDSQQRYREAETYYQRALKLAPGSVQVLNNAGNHYLGSGNRNQARECYLRVVAIDPRHPNANLQLAQMSVDNKQGAQALAYLGRLNPAANAGPAVLLLRARALALSGQCSPAAQLLNKLEEQAAQGPGIHFSAGLAFADCQLYPQAEESFARALDADPSNFDVLYNLGVAALEAGHADRATGVLETALRERPNDVDVLSALSRAYVNQDRPVDAATLLAKARKLAPRRADVVLLLAQVTARLEFFKDAAAVYDDYLKLKPADDVARRERGFTLACANQFNTAIADLNAYVRKNPRDAVGFYELAVAKAFVDRNGSLQALDRALALDPGLIQARYTRALLNIEEEKPAAAVEDLKHYLERQPNDTRALAHLGQAYVASGQAAEAAEVLKRAADLAPGSPLVLVQYRRALVKLGRTQEAAEVLARLKQAGSAAETRRPQTGLIEYLNLDPADRRARYVANLRRNAAADPGNLQWKFRLGRELLADGNTAEGLAVLRDLKSVTTDPSLLAVSGKTLLEFGQYDPARQFLEPAVAADPSLSAARLDLAIARFHLQTPEAALAELDRTAPADRKGDYYLLRAQLLDALGKIQEAVEALNRGIRAAPTRPDLYLQATAFLLKHKLNNEAVNLLKQAARILPDSRELLLAQAVTLAVIPLDDDALRLLAKLQTRWPEWDRPYLLTGIILEIQLRSAEALQALETAVALGANSPEAYYYQALAITHTAPDDLERSQAAIARALALTSKDPYIFLLAGKISLARKDYHQAIEQLVQSTRLLPTLIPAHYALHDAYKAAGDESKSAAELDAVQRIADKNAASDQSPFPAEDFVFTVRPPN